VEEDMGVEAARPEEHRHIPVTSYELRRRGGVPYEYERKVCAECRQLLEERPLRRAAA
jgi:hypothetical protein